MRSRETLQASIQFSPKLESLLANQKLILEVMIDVREAYDGLLDRMRIFESAYIGSKSSPLQKSIMAISASTSPSGVLETIRASYPVLRPTQPKQIDPWKSSPLNMASYGKPRAIRDDEPPIFDPESGEPVYDDVQEPPPSTLDIPMDDGVEDFLGTDKKAEPL